MRKAFLATLFAVFVMLLAVACNGATDTAQLPPTAQPSPTPAPPTSTPERTPTSAPAPSPTPEPTPTPEPPVTSSPTPGSRSDRDEDRFADQLTKAAPTIAAATELAPTVVARTGQHEQWALGAVSPTEQQKAQFGVAGSRAINDGRGQQYTCAYYLDGTEVPRINLAFPRDLTYSVITNQYGESQGAVNATTSVDGVVIPLEWRTWATRVDRLRLREGDAVRLVREIRERNATEFELVLRDDPELSRTYDVSDLADAIAVNDMTCFRGR